MEIANTKQQKHEDTVEHAETEQRVWNTDLKSQTFSDEEETEIVNLYQSVPEVANHFTITHKIGEGAFSCVYLARLKHYPEVSEQFALKHILPTTHPARIENELRCLLKLGGQDNVMGVKLCLRNRDNVVIVMEYFPHEKFQDWLSLMSKEEAKDYMKNLLVALRRVHQYDVIHRDIKPSNFLYDRLKKRYSLVDFGLASGSFLIDRDAEKMGKKDSTSSKTPTEARRPSRVPLSPSKINVNKETGASISYPGLSKKSASFCVPSSSTKMFLEKSGLCACLSKPQICTLCIARKNQLAPRAGTAGFRGPEVLLKSPSQDTGVDIWSAGTIFLSLLSARYPFFRAQDDIGHLAQIISLLGSEQCVEAAKSFGKTLTMSDDLPPLDLRNTCLKLRLSQMIACISSGPQLDELAHGWSNVSQQAFNLLSRMLDPNPATRITAEEALKHPYFYENCHS